MKGESFWRRHLPHWQMQGGTYFVTWCCIESFVLEPEDRDLVMSAINHWDGQRWDVLAAVVMPDHVHVIAVPLSNNEGVWELGHLIGGVKNFSSHAINRRTNRTGSVWQSERYDRLLRNEAELMEKYDYISANPIKRNLANTIDDYKWLYLKGHHSK